MPFLKPDSCKGCVFYNKSQYYTPDSIVENATIAIVAQAPGKHEEEGAALIEYEWVSGKRCERTTKVTPQPLIGASGNWLRKDFWPLTQIPYESASKCNILKCRPNDSNDLPHIGSNKPLNGITVKELKQAIVYCTRVHLKLPASTEYILAMGEIALYAFTGEELLGYKKSQEIFDETTGKKIEKKSTISEWRGWGLGVDLIEKTILGLHDYYGCNLHRSSLFPRLVTLFPVVHLASLFQNSRYYHATLLDFIRFGKLVRGSWPESLPEIQVNIVPETVPEIIGFDTEYVALEDNSKSLLTMWSMADRDRNVYVVDAGVADKLWNLPKKLTIATQNGIVDLPHFLPMIPEGHCVDINLEDCMLAHAVLWTGELNSLDYQLSKCGLYNRHKHLRESKDLGMKYMYAALDADSTLNSAWVAHAQEFSKDLLSWQEYKLRRQPLLAIINRFQERGVAVWQERVQEVSKILDAKIQEIQKEVRELTGNPEFNIRSDKMIKAALYHGVYVTEKKVPKRASKTKPTEQSLINDVMRILKRKGDTKATT